MTVPVHLPENHRVRLDWFASRAGQTTYFPEQLPDGSFLVSRPKGIFKPQGFEHAVSVRINLHSPYKDGRFGAARTAAGILTIIRRTQTRTSATPRTPTGHLSPA